MSLTFPSPSALGDLDLVHSCHLLSQLLPVCAPDIWISPGNRSQPLVRAALELEARGLCRVLMHFDERGLAFAAMGTALARQRPCLLICTSGSAVANLLPGLCEARVQGVPVIACTADRPPEEHGIGTNQTWPHPPLLQGAVGDLISFPCPDDAAFLECTELARLRVEQAKAPLHLNLPFREPFGVRLQFKDEAPLRDPDRPDSLMTLPPPFLQAWQSAKRPLVTLGALWSGLSEEVISILQRSGALILADILSQHGCRSDGIHRLVDAWGRRLAEQEPPDLWLHLGGPLLSKAFLQTMHRLAPRCFYASKTREPWDPAQLGALRLHDGLLGSPALCWEPLAQMTLGEREQRQRWSSIEPPRARGTPSEEALRLIEVFTSTPSEGLFFVGNSMPIRHLAEWAPPQADAPRIWANRGLSGIDGNLATALGVASGSSMPVSAVVGDLTALHDLNSLALLQHLQGPVRLTVLNNHGGGIFRRVVKGVEASVLAKGFLTPHSYCLKGAAELFAWPYHDGQGLPVGPGPWLWEPTLPSCVEGGF
jgi:2-succinyl-5-enolpyruvyl-6-hydroxy-3-cyclohexene-1-carboxylate synthase